LHILDRDWAIVGLPFCFDLVNQERNTGLGFGAADWRRRLFLFFLKVVCQRWKAAVLGLRGVSDEAD